MKLILTILFIIFYSSCGRDEPEGCTDPYAENYNPDANWNDGSCSGYPNNGEFSLSFDGDGDYVNLGAPDVLEFNSGNFTASAWFNTSIAKRSWMFSSLGFNNS